MNSESINVNDIVKIERSSNPNIRTIHYTMTYYCNFNCSYCIEYNTPRYKIPFITIISNTMKLIEYNNKLPKVQEIHMIILGGEVSLYNMELILSLLYKGMPNLTQVNIISNFSAPIEYYNNLLTKFDKKFRIRYILSFHDEFTKIDPFLKKFSKLNGDFKFFEVEAVLNKNNLHIIKDLYNKCIKLGYKIKIDIDKRVYKNTDAVSRDVIDFINNISDNQHSYKRYTVTFSDGSVMKFTRTELTLLLHPSNIPGYLDTSNFICYNNHSHLTFQIDKLIDLCPYYKMSEVTDSIRCPVGYCNICKGDYKFIKVEDKYDNK